MDRIAVAIKIKLTVAALPSSLTVTHNIEMKNMPNLYWKQVFPKIIVKSSYFPLEDLTLEMLLNGLKY